MKRPSRIMNDDFTSHILSGLEFYCAYVPRYYLDEGEWSAFFCRILFYMLNDFSYAYCNAKNEKTFKLFSRVGNSRHCNNEKMYKIIK